MNVRLTEVDAQETLPFAIVQPSREERLHRRRLTVLALNTVTVAGLIAAMVTILAHGGFTLMEGAMLAAFVLTTPWLSIGFWNALIGSVALRHGDAVADALKATDASIGSRTAIVMAVRNEDPAGAIGRLEAMLDDLDRAGFAANFDAHVLSDTDDPAIARREEALVAAWRARSAEPGRVHYRRRTDNAGYKAGNIGEFCKRHVGDHDHYLPLDADSFMSAAAILRLVRTMEANPSIGILQSLVVGTPARAFFTRAFQFGMRHGMRAYTAGSAWWAGDCGPYWGHNALIRMRPFHDHCKLPRLPGSGPLGGDVMSHDQVEATLMRRAGYDVRVLVEEGESFEENPPTLPDFIRRELRWCQGNLQYFALLGMPGLKPVSRIQLALAILMYVAPVAWMAFILFGTANVIFGEEAAAMPLGLGLGLFAAVMTMSFAPKLLGLAGVLFDGAEAARYGGRLRVLAGALAELVLSVLIAPVVAAAIAVFAVGLVFGVRLDWRAQTRESRAVGWGEAARSFAPQTLLGLALTALLVLKAPLVLPFAAPVLLGLVLSVPVAVLSASPRLGRWATRVGLCDVPEDRQRRATVAANFEESVLAEPAHG